MADFQVDRSAAKGQSHIISFADGTSLALWGEGNVVGHKISAAGNPVGSDITFSFGKNVDLSANPDYAVTKLSNGRIVIAVADFDNYDFNTHVATGRVAYRVFEADGHAVSSVGYLGSPTLYGTRMSVTADTKGGFSISYQERDYAQSDPKIIAQHYDANGDPTDHKISVGNGFSLTSNFTESATLWNGNLATVWTKNTGEIYGRVFNDDGPLSKEFRISAAGASALDPEIAVLNNKTYVVTWFDESEHSLQARIYGYSGAKSGAIEIAADNGKQIASHSVAALPTGGFVVVWTSSGSSKDTDGTGIRGQIYSAAGHTVGSEFQVNTRLFGDQSEPDVSVKADGRLVVSWTSIEDGDSDVRAVTLDKRTAAINFTGTSGADYALGTKYADVFAASAGNDTFNGGAGNDKLTGGKGADHLTGGLGKDTFIYKLASDSTAAASGRDFITDFSHSQGDRIDLHLIDANGSKSGNGEFKFIDSHAFTGHAGDLRYAKVSGDTFVYGDINGDKKTDFEIRLDHSLTLHASDFIL